MLPVFELEPSEPLILTLVGPLEAADRTRAMEAVRSVGGTIVACAALTAEPVEAIRLRVGGSDDVESLSRAVGSTFSGRSIGHAVRRADLSLAVPGLWIMDVDSTLIEQEVIDELARVAGRYDEVSEVTRRAMNGELDFETALRERCRRLRALPESVFDQVRARIRARTGAEGLLRALRAVGCRTAVVSGGFIQTVGPMARDLGIDFALANELEVKDGRLTGEVVGEIVDGQRKLSYFESLLERLGLSRDRTVAVGDGANDLPMIRAAGLGIAFCAKPRVREAAPVTVDLPRLDATAHHLGWSTQDLARLAAGRETNRLG